MQLNQRGFPIFPLRPKIILLLYHLIRSAATGSPCNTSDYVSTKARPRTLDLIRRCVSCERKKGGVPRGSPSCCCC
ncbi:hypothetical protein F4678DRAFT_430093 [Xylaria arbuscula]|nr:hypothetical protein F4678DRAFT_430093 [Xylaria arbuscula]